MLGLKGSRCNAGAYNSALVRLPQLCNTCSHEAVSGALQAGIVYGTHSDAFTETIPA